MDTKIFCGSLALIGTFLVSCVLIKLKKSRNKRSVKLFPPSAPIGFFGLLKVALKPTTNFADLFGTFGQYGPIHFMHLHWPRLSIVLINDLDLAKDVLQRTPFNGRPENEFWRYHAGGNYGIVTSSGKVWKEQHRFTIKKLKEAGNGVKSMENLIAIEVEELIKSLDVDKGQVISPNKRTSVPFFNSVWVLLTGQRINPTDDKANKMLLEIYEGFLQIMKLPQILLLGTHQSPISVETLTKMRRWLPILSGLDIVKIGFDSLRRFSGELIEKRQKEMLDNNNYKRHGGFIEDYLQEIHKTTNENSTFYKEQGVMNLIATIADLFIAGGETAANVLTWSLLHLIRNPQVQRKLQLELDSVIGRERRPNLDDQTKLPYMSAFLWETLRMIPASLFSLPHTTTEDTYIGHYFIPKHTTVSLNITSIHNDPKIWGDPKVFKPERFINDQGQFVNHPAVCTFSVGKRRCPARNLAVGNLFLFVSAICQQFTLEKDPNSKGFPPLAPELSGLNTPKPFFLVVRDRN